MYSSSENRGEVDCNLPQPLCWVWYRNCVRTSTDFDFSSIFGLIHLPLIDNESSPHMTHLAQPDRQTADPPHPELWLCSHTTSINQCNECMNFTEFGIPRSSQEVCIGLAPTEDNNSLWQSSISDYGKRCSWL